MSCSSQPNKYKPTSESIEREELINKILSKVAFQLKNEKQLYPIGEGGQTSRGVQMLALSFNFYQKIGIDEGRELLVAAVNALISGVNGDERIHHHLVSYPFKPNNVEIRIFLYNPDRSDPKFGQLQVISAIDGILSYKVDNPETNRFKVVYQETYDEAKQKLVMSLSAT
jgi:hypothetical protein